MRHLTILPLCLAIATLATAEDKTLKEVTVTSTSNDIAERRQAATRR
jgi:hypothetical protein